MKKHKEISTTSGKMKNDQGISTNINKHKSGNGGRSARCLPNALYLFGYYENTMWKRHKTTRKRDQKKPSWLRKEEIIKKERASESKITIYKEIARSTYKYNQTQSNMNKGQQTTTSINKSQQISTNINVYQ